MRIVILGGGCFGVFHVSRLVRARSEGRFAFDELLVVDRNEVPRCRRELGELDAVRYERAEWQEFLSRWVEVAGADDRLIPTPFAPHVAFEWARRALPKARWEPAEPPRGSGLPSEHVGKTGTLCLSHADWICPVDCDEPAECPAIRAPRTWEMRETVARFGATDIIVSRHVVDGVAMIAVADLLALRTRLSSLREPTRVAIATVSSCHGAMSCGVWHPGG